MRRVRQLGLFQGVELEELEAGPSLRELLDVVYGHDELAPDPTHDPLQDHLDDPFPEELR